VHQRYSDAESVAVVDLGSSLELLASQTHPEGGWGYTPGQSAHLEPTCLALLALSQDAGRFQPLIDKGRAFLEKCVSADGSYRPSQGREEAVWHTALVLFVQAALDPLTLPSPPAGGEGRVRGPAAEVRRTASALFNLRGRQPSNDEAKEIHDIDLMLVGWPWAENNFSWVEPTAWACLALRRAGHNGHPRVEEGLRLLLDRAHDEGGINYGNRRILGKFTEPMPGPTALMLLALQGHGAHPRVAAAVTYLLGQALSINDLELLCWAKLALDVHRDQPGVAEALPGLDARIRAAHQTRTVTPWVRPAPVREALTALALGTANGNVFQLVPDALAESTHYSAPSSQYSAPRRRSFVERLKARFSALAIQGFSQLRPLPTRTEVHIAPAGDYNANLADILQEQYAVFRARVPLAGKRVVLKPNLVEYNRDKVINTHPHVVAAVIELCRREGAAEIIVAEGPGHCRNVEYLVSASGLGDVLRHYGVPFIDLNHDEPVKTPNLGGLTKLEHLYLARTVARAEVLISLPKLKTHHWAGATLSLKNLFGTLPGICYGWPKNELHWRGIDNSIVDIALTRTPELAIVDGIVGMEGDGPLNGTPKPLGALIMGCDPLAVDATCCRLMRLDPDKIGYLVLGHRKRLGLLNAAHIDQIGEPIKSLAQSFATVPHFQPICVVL
jgi:uncharacterized protein (DUF362 family)